MSPGCHQLENVAHVVDSSRYVQKKYQNNIIFGILIHTNVSHNFKLVRATVDGVKKTGFFPSYKVKGNSFLTGFCHGAENRC